MTKTIDALVEALEHCVVGLDKCRDWPGAHEECSKAMHSATAALAQARAEQAEPVGHLRVMGRLHDYQPGVSAFDLPDGKHAIYTTPPAAPVAKPTAWRYTANGHVILMDGAEPPPDDAYDEGSLIGLAPTCKPSLQVPTVKESLTVAPVAKLEPLSDAEIRQCFDYAMMGDIEEHNQVTVTRIIEAELNAKLGNK